MDEAGKTRVKKLACAPISDNISPGVSFNNSGIKELTVEGYYELKNCRL